MEREEAPVLEMKSSFPGPAEIPVASLASAVASWHVMVSSARRERHWGGKLENVA